MNTRSVLLSILPLALGLVLAVAKPALADETSADPHHPQAGAAEGGAPAAATEQPAPAPTSPSASSPTVMPQDMMAMCPLMAAMMKHVMPDMMGQRMMGPGMAAPQSEKQTQMGMAVRGSEAAAAYRKALQTMMGGMTVTSTGNTDRDFALQMTLHHEAAVEMAKAELQYGSDSQMRSLAEGIVAAQEREIGEMREWLTHHAE
jgi:uncharacterized protein (DUF305 family)